MIKIAFIFILIVLVACNSYPSIKLSKNIFKKNGKAKETSIDNLIKYYKSSDEGYRGYPAVKRNILTENKIKHEYYYRYFTDVNSYTILAKINNKGVEYAMNGMYNEAKIIFSEILNEDNNNAPALNNLGVINELLNDSENAFNMYMKACMIEPENIYYKENFLFFCDNK